MREKILIIEDDRDISEILKYSLEKEGYITLVNPNGLEAEDTIKRFSPSLVLLDIMLNDTDGFSVCKKIVKYKIPIIMLTARGDIMDKILGLEIGADDYITKPFDIREVIARIRLSLRRREEYEEEAIKSKSIVIGNVKIDEEGRRVYVENTEKKLKPKEFELLLYLAKNTDRVFTREGLLQAIWGYDFYGDTRTVDVHITRLRSKLGESINIETVFGVGYVLREDKCLQ